MFYGIFDVPDFANATGLLNQMKYTVSEYIRQDTTLFGSLMAPMLKKRIIALQIFRKKLILNDKEQTEYAELVIQFNNYNVVNTIDNTTCNDINVSLLNE